MPEIIRGSTVTQAALTALVERSEAVRDLALEQLLELKVITLHMTDLSGAAHDQEDVELAVGQ